MGKRIFGFIIMILMLITLCGCWSKKELNEIAIVAGFAVDKTETGYKLSLQTVIPNEVAGEKAITGVAVTLYEAESLTVCDAYRQLAYTMPRRPYLAHLLLLIMSEEVAKDGITDVLSGVIRDNEIRASTNVFIAKGMKAADVFSVFTPFEKIPMNKIIKISKNVETNYTAIRPISVLELVNNLVSDGSSAVLPGVEIIGEIEKGKKLENIEKIDPDAEIKLTPFAVFNKDKLIGWLDNQTSKGFNMIMNEVQSLMVDIECEEEKESYITLDISKAKSKIEGKVVDGKPKIKIKTKIEGSICEVGCAKSLKEPDDINKLEKEYEKLIKTHLETSVKTVQTEYKTDIFGFGNIIHRKHPKAWKEFSKDWDQEFQNLDFEVEVNVNIARTGSTYDALKKDIK